jgi:phosphate transport system substrate-binding protein
MTWAASAALAMLLGPIALPTCAGADDVASAYHAESSNSGAIRCWGSAQMEDLLKLWQISFARSHPQVRFENHMYGAASAIGGLYAGAADVVLSREIWPEESQAYAQVKGHAPLVFEVATGSFDVPTKSDALGIFVAARNPLGHLTLAQLAAVFTGSAAKVWGDLGLTGRWASLPIHRYAYLYDNAGMRLFRGLVSAGAPDWNWETKAFGNLPVAGGRRVDAGQRILDALAADPDGIAISNPHYATVAVKSVAIGRSADGPFIPLTRETVRDRSYPLTRGVFLYVDRLDARLIGFLQYVLSTEGRADVAREGDYLPLTDFLIARERAKLRQESR